MKLTKKPKSVNINLILSFTKITDNPLCKTPFPKLGNSLKFPKIIINNKYIKMKNKNNTKFLLNIFLLVNISSFL